MVSLLPTFGNALDEGADGGPPVHASPLMWSPLVVVDEISIKGGLHLVHGFKPCFAPFSTEVLVEQGSVKALHNPIGLGSVWFSLSGKYRHVTLSACL